MKRELKAMCQARNDVIDYIARPIPMKRELKELMIGSILDTSS